MIGSSFGGNIVANYLISKQGQEKKVIAAVTNGACINLQAALKRVDENWFGVLGKAVWKGARDTMFS